MFVCVQKHFCVNFKPDVVSSKNGVAELLESFDYDNVF